MGPALRQNLLTVNMLLKLCLMFRYSFLYWTYRFKTPKRPSGEKEISCKSNLTLQGFKDEFRGELIVNVLYQKALIMRFSKRTILIDVLMKFS